MKDQKKVNVWLVLVVMSPGVLMTLLDATIVSGAIPSILSSGTPTGIASIHRQHDQGR
jgi:hypothetical protein